MASLVNEDVPAFMPRDRLGLRNEYVAPQSEEERRLVEIWCEAFEIERIGIDDDFFDLGGDSIIAVSVSVSVSDSFDIDFKPSQIMAQNTIRLMARDLVASRTSTLPGNVVLARSSDARPPLFLVHGQYGITFLQPEFMSGFHDDQPVYIFQVPGFNGVEDPYDRVEDIAADYLHTMLKIQKSGPYLIAAFCAGSWIALEIANQMKRQGKNLDRLILIDPALHSAMDDEFLVNRGRISGGGIPILSSLVASAKLAGSDFLRRTKFLFRTGHWVNGQDHASFALPAVQRFWVGRQRKRLDQTELKRVASATTNRRTSSVETDTRSHQSTDVDRPESEIKMLDAAAYASAKLQLAFRTYRPEPFNGTVDLIVCKKAARMLKYEAYPINRVLPIRREIVFGETHADAVAGADPRNARLIQKMLDEAIAANDRGS